MNDKVGCGLKMLHENAFSDFSIFKRFNVLMFQSLNVSMNKHAFFNVLCVFLRQAVTEMEV